MEPGAIEERSAAAAEDMKLHTKYDFIPGGEVIFYDDLSREEVGGFPSRWRPDRSVFEIARQGGQNWIMCTDNGVIRPRTATGPLPPRYTIEMDFYVEVGSPSCRDNQSMDLWDEPDNPMLLRSFRFAEGGKTLKQQLDETGRQGPGLTSSHPCDTLV